MVDRLQFVRDTIGDCTRCKLCETRTHIVFGSGDPNADWMFVGEGPGENEDLQGLPFVGRSGELLTQLINESGWSREDVYISNIVKCRPPKNRDPQPDEIEACKPFLFRQIQIVQPKVIITLGKQASNLLLDNKEPMYKMRGNTYELYGAKVIPTYHPSYILRGNTKALEFMREDFARALINLY